jgi:hypothetical protein
MSTASILRRLERIERALNLADEEPFDWGPTLIAQMATIRERLKASGHARPPGPPSGSRLSVLIEAARKRAA